MTVTTSGVNAHPAASDPSGLGTRGGIWLNFGTVPVFDQLPGCDVAVALFETKKDCSCSLFEID
jgi:hypothetical protein